jgi:aspartyl protease family protein
MIQLVGLIGFLLLILGSLSVRRLRVGFLIKTVLGWAAIGAAIWVAVINKDAILDQVRAIGAQIGVTEPAQVAHGQTVRIRLSPDGHFWARATINGVERRMLIDSGATVSAISEDTARAADIAFENGAPVRVSTANGAIDARRANINRVDVGPLTTQDLTVFVASSFGDLDVLGMNFLTRLKSWRVEGNVLILEPQADGDLT